MLIYNSTEDIGDAYGPSLNEALRRLHQVSGIAPIVRKPYGGKRTEGQQLEINPGFYPPGASDHVKGRGVDIWNWAEYHAWNRTKFIAILRLYGWRNIDIHGNDFPSEKWHHANHMSLSQLAGLQLTTLSEGDDDMPRMIRSTSRKMRFLIDTGYLYAIESAERTWFENRYGDAEDCSDTAMDLYSKAIDVPRDVWRTIEHGYGWSRIDGVHKPMTAERPPIVGGSDAPSAEVGSTPLELTIELTGTAKPSS